ncbi:PIN domain-containing protein [Kitasatospora griseola]|uniref:PIN domain-containing protein n=1 Tax=Kitasatospora griseola TaxID=2064 RepID=UPI0037FAEF4D
MQLSLLPGVNRDDALQALRKVSEDVNNLYTGSNRYDAGGLLLAYLEWTSNAIYRLERVFSPTDIDRLVFTRRYEQLLAGASDLGAAHLARVTDQLVHLELSQRARDFEAAADELRATIHRWERWGRFAHNVAFDTSVFIQHPNKLEDIEFHALPGVGDPYSSFCLIVPMAVIDELDRLKESGKSHTRWRAGYSLAILDKIFADSRLTRAALHAPSEHQIINGLRPIQHVTVELLFDPPHHVRLPNPDDEIVDRVLAAQPFIDDKVTLFTYDTGQSSRARVAKLPFRKLSMPSEPEPSAAPPKTERRQNRDAARTTPDRPSTDG